MLKQTNVNSSQYYLRSLENLTLFAIKHLVMNSSSKLAHCYFEMSSVYGTFHLNQTVRLCNISISQQSIDFYICLLFVGRFRPSAIAWRPASRRSLRECFGRWFRRHRTPRTVSCENYESLPNIATITKYQANQKIWDVDKVKAILLLVKSFNVLVRNESVATKDIHCRISIIHSKH